MKTFVLPMLGLAAALALSPVVGVAGADAAPLKHKTHHVVHHPRHVAHHLRTVHKVHKTHHVVHHAHKKPVKKY